MIAEFFDGPSWSSPAAQQAWEAPLRDAAAAWTRLEYLSVVARLRDSCLLVVPWNELPARQQAAAADGLVVTALASTFSSGYSAGTPTSGTPAIRAAVHRPGLEAAWVAAWAAGDDDAIGMLLGFPLCCRAFFKGAWVDAGGRDSTPYMAQLDGPARGNILLRWLGVRLVPHLPCSGDCPFTSDRADAFAALGRAAGLGYQMDAAEAMLGWQMEWTASHGIGEVVTPALRFRFSTAHTAALVRRTRVGAPKASAPPEPSPWADNGFATPEAMNQAHKIVLAAVAASGGTGTVIDLGCGDGELLSKINAMIPGSTGFGIDVDPGRVKRGMARHSGLDLRVESIEDFGEPSGDPWGLMLLMPGRLLEMPEATRAKFVAWLPKMAARVVVYSYGDWGELKGLCGKAGLPVPTAVEIGPGVEAGSL